MRLTSIEAEIDKQQRNIETYILKDYMKELVMLMQELVFLDLLSNLERIGDHSTNIAEIVVENNA